MDGETLAEFIEEWTDGEYGKYLARGIENSEWLEEKIRQAKAEALEEAAEIVSTIMNDPERVRPQIGPMRTDLANDIEWALLILRGQAAGIREESN